MALRANLEAKQRDKARFQSDLAYRFKCFLLNALVLLFQERHHLIFVEQKLRKGLPTLLIQVNAQNQLTLDLRFFIGDTFFADTDLQLCREGPGPKRYVGLHLPRNQLIPEAAKIIKTGLSP